MINIAKKQAHSGKVEKAKKTYEKISRMYKKISDKHKKMTYGKCVELHKKINEGKETKLEYPKTEYIDITFDEQSEDINKERTEQK